MVEVKGVVLLQATVQRICCVVLEMCAREFHYPQQHESQSHFEEKGGVD